MLIKLKVLKDTLFVKCRLYKNPNKVITLFNFFIHNVDKYLITF